MACKPMEILGIPLYTRHPGATPKYPPVRGCGSCPERAPWGRRVPSARLICLPLQEALRKSLESLRSHRQAASAQDESHTRLGTCWRSGVFKPSTMTGSGSTTRREGAPLPRSTRLPWEAAPRSVRADDPSCPSSRSGKLRIMRARRRVAVPRPGAARPSPDG